MALSKDEVKSRVQAKLDANDVQADTVEVLEKASGVWLAYITRPGSDEVEQGVFTEQSLQE